MVLTSYVFVWAGEKPFQCERCAERFTKKEYLIIHMRTHTGEGFFFDEYFAS